MSDIPTWVIWLAAAAVLLVVMALAVAAAKCGTGQERAAGIDPERDAMDKEAVIRAAERARVTEEKAADAPRWDHHTEPESDEYGDAAWAEDPW
jgi:Tfp pilus assembly protein PilX